MNLLSDPWLPFRIRDGSIIYRLPTAIADPNVVDLALPRADFQGAAYQWLIGLLQTVIPPESNAQWADRFEVPPSQEELEAAFSPFASAFELNGDGPRFMQDLDPLDEPKPTTVAGLLIEAPGANGIKNNTDHFIKRGVAEEICPDCAAIALFTLQINAPAGGAGYRVGLRGGGPLTTLVLPEDPQASLWHKLWLNAMTPERITANGQTFTPATADNGDIFPWVAPTRVSDKKGSEVQPNEVHPLQVYWAMPRRFRLLVEDKTCICQLCGRESDKRVRELKAKNYGINYDGPWLHPLTPYRQDPKKRNEPPLSSKGQPGGLGYRHWLGLALLDADESGALPAAAVSDYMASKMAANREARQWGDDIEALIEHARLWVFGYDMDNMKARGWYAVEMPLVAVPIEQQETLREWVKAFIQLSRDTAWKLRNQIKSAWFKRPADAKGDMSHIDMQFYEATEAAFFRALREMGEALAKNSKEVHAPSTTAEAWYRTLRRHALQMFDAQALSGPLEELDMKRLIRARQHLLFWLMSSGKGSKPVADFARLGGFDIRPAQDLETKVEVDA
nr:type I-E CRISPR-associated protein Cse1/CasA [uncultured Halomonas sp.]